jgi:caffeoyl-CoA O-methyltransferase
MTREEYVEQLAGEDDVLSSVRASIVERGMPPISVAVELGRLLNLLVKTSGAKRVLEIGALGGYSGICLARALPGDGKLVSLELNPEFADVAQGNLQQAGLDHLVEYKLGPAIDSLQELVESGEKFDLFFIDADKPNYPYYLDYAIQLSSPGALITADNVLLGNRVMDENNHDPGPEAIRAFNERLHSDVRLEALILPARDGFAIARVK